MTSYQQTTNDFLAIVQEGLGGWIWSIYELPTRQLVTACKKVSSSQEEAYIVVAEAIAILTQPSKTAVVPIPTTYAPSHNPSTTTLSTLPSIHTAADRDTILHAEFTHIQGHPQHNFAPYRRLFIYDALGPTWAAAHDYERQRELANAPLPLTRADRIRARIAIATAYHVLPLWDAIIPHYTCFSAAEMENHLRYSLEVMIEFDLPTALRNTLLPVVRTSPVEYAKLSILIAPSLSALPPDQATLLQTLIQMGEHYQTGEPSDCLRMTLPPALHLHWGVGDTTFLAVPLTELPIYTLNLAEAVLYGTITAAEVMPLRNILETMVGTYLGHDQDTLPAQAFDVYAATYEALQQALGRHPFNGIAITPTTTELEVAGIDAAAAPAVRAVSGIFEDTYPTDRWDGERQLAFWSWWLEEAIPNAWAAEPLIDNPLYESIPFHTAIHPRRVHIKLVTFVRADPDNPDALLI